MQLNTANTRDLAVPYLSQIGFKYLITGLPRIRSAWFAALLSNDEFPCYHDILSMGTLIKDKAFGLSDPSAACAYPNTALNCIDKNCKVVFISRTHTESKDSLSKKYPEADWNGIVSRYVFFCDKLSKKHPIENLLMIDFDALNSYETVNKISLFCTGKKLSRKRYRLFDALRIEQHVDKARARIDITEVA